MAKSKHKRIFHGTQEEGAHHQNDGCDLPPDAHSDTVRKTGDDIWKEKECDEMWEKYRQEQAAWDEYDRLNSHNLTKSDFKEIQADAWSQFFLKPESGNSINESNDYDGEIIEDDYDSDEYNDDYINYEGTEDRHQRQHKFAIGNPSTLIIRTFFVEHTAQEIIPYLRYRGVFPEKGGDIIPWLKTWFNASSGFFWGFTGKSPIEGNCYIVRTEKSYYDAEKKVFKITFSIGNCHGRIVSPSQLPDSFPIKVKYVSGLSIIAELTGKTQTTSRLLTKTFIFYTAEGITGELSQFLDTGAFEIKKTWANEKLPLDLLLRIPEKNLIQLDMFPFRQVWMTETDAYRFVVDCDVCQTEGKIKCPNCKGAGKVKCEKCEGSGTVTLPKKEVTCKVCGGSGSLGNKYCFKCGGSGVFKLHERDVACRNCEGSGNLECPACDGQGRKKCSKCNGTGINFIVLNRDTRHFFKNDKVFIINTETKEKIPVDGGWFELVEEVSSRNKIAKGIKKNKKKLLADGQSVSKCLDEALKLAPAIITSPIELYNPSGTIDRGHRKVILEFQINGQPKWLKQGISPYPDGTPLNIVNPDGIPLNIVNIDSLEDIQSRIEYRGIDFDKRTIKVAFPANIDSSRLENTLIKIVPGCPPPPEKCQKRYLEYWLEEGENHFIDAISSGIKESRKPIKSFYNHGIKKYPSQVNAVQQGVSDSEVMLLQGPPGTGKTTVIVEIIRQALKRGGRILVTSQTHQAVSNVLEKLHCLNESHQAYIPMVRYASRDNMLSEIEKRYEAGYQEEERKSILERASKSLSVLLQEIKEYEDDNSIYPDAIATATEIEKIIAARQKDISDNQAVCAKQENAIEKYYQDRKDKTVSEYNKHNHYLEELLRQLTVKIAQLTELMQNRESCIAYEKDAVIFEDIVKNAKKLLEIREKLKQELNNNQQSRERQRAKIHGSYISLLKTATADFKEKDKLNTSNTSAAKAKHSSLERKLKYTINLIKTYGSRLANRSKDSLMDKVFSLVDRIPLLHTVQSVETIQRELEKERRNQISLESEVNEANNEYQRLYKIECDFKDGFKRFQDEQQLHESAKQEGNDKRHDEAASAFNQQAENKISLLLEQQKKNISKLKKGTALLDCDDSVSNWSIRLADTQRKIQSLYAEAAKIRNRDCNTDYLNEQIRIRSKLQTITVLSMEASDILPDAISEDKEKFIKYQLIFENDKRKADDKYKSDMQQYEADRQKAISDNRQKHDDIRSSIERTATDKLAPLYALQDSRCRAMRKEHIKDGKNTPAQSWNDYYLRSKQVVDGLKRRASVKEKWTRDLEANPEALSKFLNSQAKVFFSTCVGLGSWKELRDGTYERITPDIQSIVKSKFDLVIIDEAGHATFSETIIPMCFAKKVILIGDDKQLPPVLGNDLDLPCHKNMCSTCLSGVNGKKEECWFEYSLFAYLWQNTNFQLPRLMLDTQFRMHPDIGTFISSAFYGGKLHNGVSSKDRLFAFGPFQKPVCVVSTSGKTKRYETFTDPSYFNEMEAKYIEGIIGSLVDDLQERPSLGKQISGKISLAVITPYSSQVDLLRRNLSKYFNRIDTLDFSREHIASVDKFQGSERDIIITSFVRSPKPCSSCNGTGIRKGRECPSCRGKGHKGGSLCFVHDLKRMNVAFSRARKMLILVGDIEALCEYKGTVEGKEVLLQFYDYVKDKGRVLHVWEEETK